MRKAAFFGFLLVSYYLAGMYHSQALMALCLGMLLAAAAAFVQAGELRAGLSAAFPPKIWEAVQGKETVLPVCITSRRPLRAGRCVLTIEAGYGEEEELPAARLEAPVRHGENGLEVSLLAPCCGLLFLRIPLLEGQDYFSLFRFKKPCNTETVLAVFPPPERLNIGFSPLEGQEAAPLMEQAKPSLGENIHEIRQLREYRIGDQNRRIHWNLSARTGKLWLKEPEGDEAPSVALCLAWGEKALPPQEKSDFFRLFQALALGLLDKGFPIEVSWRDREGRLLCEKIVDGEAIRPLLLSLYRLSAEGFPPRPPVPEDRQGAFVLDTELGWYWEAALLYRFSSGELEKEIQEKTFWL